MRAYFAGLLVLILTSVLFASLARTVDENRPLTIEEKIFGLSLVWQEANYSYAFFDLVPDLDWDAEYRKAITRVTATFSNYEFLREVQRFVALLGEAHTNLEPGKEYRQRYGGHPAVELEELERKAIVVNSAKELSDLIPIGSMIVKVDGEPVDDYLAEKVFPYMSASTEHYLWRQSIRGHKWRAVGLLTGEVATKVNLVIQTPSGDRREVVLERLSPDAEVPWYREPRTAFPMLTFRRLEGDIAYFALNTFNKTEVVAEFEKHLDELKTARAVILDVRNNDGGNSQNGWNIGRYFSSKPLETSHWRTRAHIAAYKAWGKYSKDPVKKAHAAMDAWDGPTEFSRIDPPEKDVFEVPVAILIGSSTYSAAEDFLSFLRAVTHCIFVGGRSAGSTGQLLSFKIPGGAWVGITSKRDTAPDGTEFVGRGFEPDIEVHQTVAAYRSGRDLVLERAVEVLKEKLQ